MATTKTKATSNGKATKTPVNRVKKKLGKSEAAAKRQKTKMDMPKKLKTLTARTVKFTSGAMAEAWLKQDELVREKTGRKNRKLTPSNITKKFNDMVAGNFVTTSQGPTVDWDGAIIDGQHTLKAIVRYFEHMEFEGIYPIPEIVLFVKEGENPEHFPFYDQGKTRSAEDVLGIDGEEYAKELAVAIRLVWIRIYGKKVSGAGQKSPYELKKLLEDHKSLRQSVKFVMSFGQNKKDESSFPCKSTMSPGYAAAFHYLMLNCEESKTDKKKVVSKVNQFWEEVINHDGEKNSGSWRLWRKLEQIKNDPNSKITRDALVDMIVQGFNRFWENDKTKFTDYNSSDRYFLNGLDASLAPKTEAE